MATLGPSPLGIDRLTAPDAPPVTVKDALPSAATTAWQCHPVGAGTPRRPSYASIVNMESELATAGGMPVTLAKGEEAYGVAVVGGGFGTPCTVGQGTWLKPTLAFVVGAVPVALVDEDVIAALPPCTHAPSAMAATSEVIHMEVFGDAMIISGGLRRAVSPHSEATMHIGGSARQPYRNLATAALGFNGLGGAGADQA